MRPPVTDVLREIALVCRDDLSGALRSFLAVAALGLYLAMNLAVAIPYLALSKLFAQELAARGSSAEMAWEVAQQAAWRPLFEWLTGDPQAAAAMMEIPLQAVFTFVVASVFAPLVAVLVSHDQVADDLKTGHIRFLSVRCRRGSLVAGRMLSRTLLMAGVVVLVGAGDFALMATREEGLPPGAWRHFAGYTAVLVAVLPCWVALAALASTLVRSPLAALLLAMGLLFALSLLAASETAGWLSPVAYKGLLYSPVTQLRGVGIYLVFASLFGGLAWLRLRTRDL